jgi:hypothetical protein
MLTGHRAWLSRLTIVVGRRGRRRQREAEWKQADLGRLSARSGYVRATARAMPESDEEYSDMKMMAGLLTASSRSSSSMEHAAKRRRRRRKVSAE